MKCYLCNENEANSVEHTIPNAIGGKIKATILCRDCNSKYGDSCDAALANSLRFFSNWINHPRDRGNIPDLPCKIIDTDGKEFSIERGASSKEYNSLNRNKHINHGNSLELSFTAFGNDGEQRLRKEYKQTLTNWGKKHGWNKERLTEELQKMEATIAASVKKVEYPQIVTTLRFDGKEVYLSCLKTAMNFYIQRGHDKQYIENAIRIIKDQCNDIFKVANTYYPKDFFPTDSIFHVLYLKGDSKNRKLLCLISYYNVFQSLLLLNKDYDGTDFEEKYCYDIWNEKEINFAKSLNIDTTTIQTVLENENEYLESTQEQVVKMINIFAERFVAGKDFTQTGTQILLDLIQEELKKLVLQDSLLDKQQFAEIITNKLSLRPKELNLLKDKDIKEVVTKIGDFLFEEYLRQKTHFFLSSIISKISTDIIITDIYINKTDIKDLNWDSIKQKILEITKTVKFDDERLNAFIPDSLNNITSNMDSSIAVMKDTIIRFCNCMRTK